MPRRANRNCSVSLSGWQFITLLPCSRQPSPSQKGFYFIAVSKTGPWMKGQRVSLLLSSGGCVLRPLLPQQSACVLHLSQLVKCPGPVPTAVQRQIGVWSISSVKGVPLRCSHLVCPLMIVLLWLLSIWKNTSVNKVQYLLSESEPLHAPPYCCNGYTPASCQVQGPL